MERAADLAAAFAECERIVRDGDPDRYVSTSFAPAESRPALLALYAFNTETARVRDLVSQPLPGEIRLQWWRERIEAAPQGGAESGQGSPVASALGETIRRHALPVDAFDRFLEARIFDLYDDPMPSRADFEAYAGATASAVIMLAATILDRDEAPQAADPAGHAGVAQAATGVLRMLPLHSSRRQVYLPADILEATGTSADAWLRGGGTARAPVEAMIAFAREHLRTARERLAAMPRGLRPAFLPAMLSDDYLKRIGTFRGIPDRGSGEIGPIRRSWVYWRSMRA